MFRTGRYLAARSVGGRARGAPEPEPEPEPAGASDRGAGRSDGAQAQAQAQAQHGQRPGVGGVDAAGPGARPKPTADDASADAFAALASERKQPSAGRAPAGADNLLQFSDEDEDV